MKDVGKVSDVLKIQYKNKTNLKIINISIKKIKDYCFSQFHVVLKKYLYVTSELKPHCF